MNKYLGSKMTAYAAFIAPLFVIFPLIFGIAMLSTEISGATVLIAIGSVMCTVIWGYYIVSVSNQLYSWGRFQSEDVRVRTGFAKKHTIIYKKCKSCGIGFYTHGVLNSKVGTKECFIFLSYDAFDESFRANINLWKPTETRIKVGFSKKLYQYLISNLPEKQSSMLQRDYERYMR